MDMSLQEEIIARFGVQPSIDPNLEIEKRVDFLKHHVRQAEARGLLIAISGELESAVAAALCKLATDSLTAESDGNFMTVGVFQPYGEEAETENSYAVAEVLKLRYRIETNIEEAVNEVALEAEFALKSMGIHQHLSRGGKDGVKARTRSMMQAALAAELNLLVAGAEHASGMVGGKHPGWGSADVRPLATLTCSQIRQLAAALGLPESMAAKAPGRGSGGGLEAWFGISPEDVDQYLEGGSIDPKAREKLEGQYRQREHKLGFLPGI